MIGELQPQQIEALLKSQYVGRIGCYADDKIYVVPTSYAYDGTYIYAHALEGAKLANMRQNPAICFETDNVSDMANWKSVIVWGTFEELTADEEKLKAVRVLLNRQLPFHSSITTHVGSNWPFLEDGVQEIEGVLYRIVITKKTGRFEQTSFSPQTVM